MPPAVVGPVPTPGALVGETDDALSTIQRILLKIPQLEMKICGAVALAVDEIVDPVRSRRWTIGELSRPEKTVIGTRVENIIRTNLELPRATPPLDVMVGDHRVDIKFTIGKNWMIPPEAVEQVCLLVRIDGNIRVSSGLLRTTELNLNAGRNRDGKRTVNALGRERIQWIVTDGEPDVSAVRFMAGLEPQLRNRITDTGVGAQRRLNELFRSLLNKPIPERVVQAVAQPHKDWQRRLRPDRRNRLAPGQIGFDVFRQASPRDRRALAQRGIELPADFLMALPV